MNASLRIRPVAPNDMPLVRELVFQTAHEAMEPDRPYVEFQTEWNAWGVFDDLHDADASYVQRDGAFFVSECDGQIVGTGAILRFESPDTCELKRIALKPAYRGRGFGYALIRALMLEARAKGYQRMVLWTNRYRLTRAVALYRQMGFVEIPQDGADWDVIWMARDLQDL